MERKTSIGVWNLFNLNTFSCLLPKETVSGEDYLRHINRKEFCEAYFIYKGKNGKYGKAGFEGVFEKCSMV